MDELDSGRETAAVVEEDAGTVRLVANEVNEAARYSAATTACSSSARSPSSFTSASASWGGRRGVTSPIRPHAGRGPAGADAPGPAGSGAGRAAARALDPVGLLAAPPPRWPGGGDRRRDRPGGAGEGHGAVRPAQQPRHAATAGGADLRGRRP